MITVKEKGKEDEYNTPDECDSARNMFFFPFILVFYVAVFLSSRRAAYENVKL